MLGAVSRVSAGSCASTHRLVSVFFLISCLAAGSGTGSIKARFENIAKQKEEEDRKRAEEERARRQTKEKQEQEEARRKAELRAKTPSPVPASSPSPTPPAQPAMVPVYQVGQAGSAPAAAGVRVGFLRVARLLRC